MLICFVVDELFGVDVVVVGCIVEEVFCVMVMLFGVEVCGVSFVGVYCGVIVLW